MKPSMGRSCSVYGEDGKFLGVSNDAQVVCLGRSWKYNYWELS